MNVIDGIVSPTLYFLHLNSQPQTICPHQYHSYHTSGKIVNWYSFNHIGRNGWVAIIVKALTTAGCNTSCHTAINKFETLGSRQETRNGIHCHNEQATSCLAGMMEGVKGIAEISVTAARTNLRKLMKHT